MSELFDFIKAEIHEGDICYVMSDLLALMKDALAKGETFDRDAFLDALLSLTGKNGTLLIPVFNWDFCKRKAFDILRTPSQTGALGNAAMKRSDFVRTRHPIYSFMVAGKDMEYLSEIDPVTSFGEGTVFDYLDKHAAKGIVIGLPMTEALTFLHHIEQITGVPYRYEKNFSAPYTDREGLTEEKTYSMYVRDLEKDPRYLDSYEDLEQAFIRANAVKSLSGASNQSADKENIFVPCHVIDLQKTVPVVRDDILHNDSRMLYTYNGQAPR